MDRTTNLIGGYNQGFQPFYVVMQKDKKVGALIKLMNGMATKQVCIIKSLQVRHNRGKKCHFIHISFIPNNYWYATNCHIINCFNSREEEKTQEKISIMLGHVVGNYDALLYPFTNS